MSTQTTQRGVLRAEVACTQPSGLTTASQQAPCHCQACRMKVVASPRSRDLLTNATACFECSIISFALRTQALCPISAKVQCRRKQVRAHERQSQKWKHGREKVLSTGPPLTGVSQQAALMRSTHVPQSCSANTSTSRYRQERSRQAAASVPFLESAFKLVTT